MLSALGAARCPASMSGCGDGCAMSLEFCGVYERKPQKGRDREVFDVMLESAGNTEAGLRARGPAGLQNLYSLFIGHLPHNPRCRVCVFCAQSLKKKLRQLAGGNRVSGKSLPTNPISTGMALHEWEVLHL